MGPRRVRVDALLKLGAFAIELEQLQTEIGELLPRRDTDGVECIVAKRLGIVLQVVNILFESETCCRRRRHRANLAL